MPPAPNLYNENITDYLRGAGAGQKGDEKHMAVQVTRYVGGYIRDYVGADQLIYKDTANHAALPEKWVGTHAVEKEYRRLKIETRPKCKMHMKKDGLVLKYTKEDGETFLVQVGDVVRCKGRVFGLVKRIDEPLGSARPNPMLHLHLWRHERDGMLQSHAHPKRLFQLEDCGDVSFHNVVEKIEIVPGYVRPGFHPNLLKENQYICSHRVITATNSFIAIPPAEGPGCPGCAIKSKKKPRFTSGDFVLYRLPGKDSARDPCDIGLINQASSNSLLVTPLSRWDTFTKQEGIAEAAVFRKDEKLWYLPTTAASIKIDLATDVFELKIRFIGLSKVVELGRALRSRESTLSDFWVGKRFVDESEDLFCLIDGSKDLGYLYQSDEKRRQFGGRSDFVNKMRLDVPLPSIIQLCVDRQEQVTRIGAQTGIIDCCAGIGAFSTGLVDGSKASIPLAIENDAEIAELYGKLHPKTVVVDKGVAFAAKNWQVLEKRAKMERFKHVILQAGVPCQPFSGKNRFKDVNDPKLGVIFEVLSLLQVSGASHLLIECVSGMLFHRNGGADEYGGNAAIVCMALRILLDLGYQFTLNVHQAAAYGTPQSRRRIFIWAAKIGTPLPQTPLPTHYAGSMGTSKLCRYELQAVPSQGPLYYVTCQDAISDLTEILNARTLAFNGSQRSQFFGYQMGAKSYKTVALTNYQSSLRNYSDARRVDLHYCHVPTESAWPAPDDEKDARRRLPEAFPCITTSDEIAHPTQDRLYSIRELTRAQGMRDDLQLRWNPGPLSEAELSKEWRFVCSLVGNAVPVPLARAQGRAFIKSLF